MEKCKIKSFSNHHVVYSSGFDDLIPEQGIYGTYYPVPFQKKQDNYCVFFEQGFRLRRTINSVNSVVFSIVNGELIVE